MGRFQLQANQKEHHHDAELGEVHDVFSLAADEAEKEGADQDPADQIPQDRSQAEPFGDGDENDRRRQIDESVLQESVAHVLFAPAS